MSTIQTIKGTQPLTVSGPMHTLRFAGLSGSLRKGSYNTALLRAAQSLVPDEVSFETVEIGHLPLFNADIDDPEQLNRINNFRESLRRADAFVIASPEYNYSIPGLLKNAIDWASRGKDSPLQNKPVAIMGASPGMLGTARMQMHLRQVFLFNNMMPVNKPEVFVNQAQSKFNAEGSLSDEKTINAIRQQMIALKDLALKVHAMPQ
jgi:chromate reductase